MDEIKSLSFQMEKIALKLSVKVQKIYDSLKELHDLTILLFKNTSEDNDSINRWLADEMFAVDGKGYFRRSGVLDTFHNKMDISDEVTYHWPGQLKDDLGIRFRFYALREVAFILKKIKDKLGNVSIIYYQDVISNGAIAYPYFDMADAIPADFSWKEYYTYLSVNPENNPERLIQRTPPNIDYAGEGLITIFSIPIYVRGCLKTR
ncbi:MAG: hypothetical protein AAF518_27925 [Spirochaetota bacterium]